MPLNRRPGQGRRAVIAAGALLAAGVAVFLAPGAWAADTPPTTAELMARCGHGTDLCRFDVEGDPETFRQAAATVGRAANCTTRAQDMSVSWERTTSSTTTLDTSVSLTTGLEVFETGFKAAYGHAWTSSVTDRDTTVLSVPAGHLGQVSAARELERVSGRYELHFGSRFHGHYYWFVPMTVTSPKTDGNDAVTTRSTPMTAEERTSYCG